MLMVNNLVGFGAGGSTPPVTISFTASAQREVSPAASVITDSSIAIGTASATRKVVVGAACVGSAASARSVSSMTIGGVSATYVIGQSDALGSQQYRVEIWQATVPTGTTGDIVTTWNANVAQHGIGVYAIYDAASAAHDTGGSTASPMSDTLNIPANGVAVGVAGSNGGATFTWTNLTEAYDAEMKTTGGTNQNHTGAYAAFATLQTGLAITCAETTGTARRMAIASWGQPT